MLLLGYVSFELIPGWSLSDQAREHSCAKTIARDSQLKLSGDHT